MAIMYVFRMFFLNLVHLTFFNYSIKWLFFNLSPINWWDKVFVVVLPHVKLAHTDVEAHTVYQLAVCTAEELHKLDLLNNNQHFIMQFFWNFFFFQQIMG